MKQEIPWTKLLIEAVLIVGSILLAFGIQAFWDERQQRIAEQVALEALYEEFESNIRLFESAQAFHIQLAQGSKHLVNLLSDANSETLSVPDSELVPLVTFLTRESATGTLSTLLASGQIDLIQNQELQQSLAQWPSILSDSSEEEIGVRNFVIEQLIPGLAGHVDLSGVMAARTSAGLLTNSAFALSGQSYEMSVNPVTLTLVGERSYLAQMLLRGTSRRLVSAEKILSLIEAQLQ